jgi:hypothetical protein
MAPHREEKMRLAARDQYTTIVRSKTAQIDLNRPKTLARKTNGINHMV